MSAGGVGKESMGLERPDEYSDEEWEAFLDGFAQAMSLVRAASGAWAEKVREQQDREQDECPECGREKINALGREEKACPVCEL